MTDKLVSVAPRLAKQWLRRLSLGLCAGLLALAAAQVLSGNYQVHPVLTGSMRPGFSLGSVVVVKRVPATSLAERDVIIFHKPTNPSEFVVHRIVSITGNNGVRQIETKGDDNPVKDPWKFTLRGDSAYRAQFTVPFVGYAALWLHQPSTRRNAAFLGAIALLVAAGSQLLKRDAAPSEPTVASVDLDNRGQGPAPAALQAAPDIASPGMPLEFQPAGSMASDSLRAGAAPGEPDWLSAGAVDRPFRVGQLVDAAAPAVSDALQSAADDA